MIDQNIYSYVTVEGNIGTGKTSLCQLLAREVNAELVLEEFAENPFLSQFYSNPQRYAFSVELFFLTERHKQMQEAFGQRSLFQEMILSDYCIPKTLIFAKNTLTDDEFNLFNRIYHTLFTNFPKPSLLVYLHRPVEFLLSNIHDRGRPYEQKISPEYLLGIQNAYFEYFKGVTTFPILLIDLKDIDFVNRKKDFQTIYDLLKRPYQPGLNRISLH
ncbi:MAG: deoxynucleoside kinase [Saprospiraceae bacterium]|nr:deoxynucleoside kinase [Saprospiraceae bacterium]